MSGPKAKRAERSKVLREMQGLVLHSAATAAKEAGAFAGEASIWNALLEAPHLAAASDAAKKARRVLQRLDVALDGSMEVPAQKLNDLTFRLHAHDLQEAAEGANIAALAEVAAMCTAIANLVEVALCEAAVLAEAADELNGALDEEDAAKAEQAAAEKLERLKGSEPFDDTVPASWETAKATWAEALRASRRRRRKADALKATARERAKK